MKKEELFLLRDFIFKSMFKESVAFRKMLERIFKYYFDFSFEDYNLTSEELVIFNKQEIKNRVDILMSKEDINYYLNIEANVGNETYYDNRNLLYEAKLILHIFRKTEDYQKDFKVIQININDIKCPVDEEITDSTLIMYDRKNEIKDERIITHHLYLGKYKEIDYNEIKEIEKDLAMLVCKDIKRMEHLAKGNKERTKVMEEYKKKISDEEFLEALWDPEWDKQMIINTERKIGREEGREEGQKEKTIQVAKSMIEEKISLDTIIKCTGLSKEEIEKL